VGKTFKDLKDWNLKRQKQGSRLQTIDMDLRTRTKPLDKKGKGGGKNWRNEVDNWLEEDYDNDEGDLA